MHFPLYPVGKVEISLLIPSMTITRIIDEVLFSIKVFQAMPYCYCMFLIHNNAVPCCSVPHNNFTILFVAFKQFPPFPVSPIPLKWEYQ